MLKTGSFQNGALFWKVFLKFMRYEKSHFDNYYFESYFFVKSQRYGTSKRAI
jgi:hypothetical protein